VGLDLALDLSALIFLVSLSLWSAASVIMNIMLSR